MEVTTLVAWVEHLRGSPWALPVFMGVFVAACFVTPVSVFPVAGGVLFGFGRGMAINLVCLLAGASGAFWLARRLGREFFSRRLRRWGHGPIAGSLRHPGPGVIIVVRLLGVPPFVITNYLAGLSGMRWRRFVWTSLVGILPWTFVMTLFSGTLWDVLKQAGLQGFRRAFLGHARPLIFGSVAVAIFLAGSVLLKKWLDTRPKSN